MHSEWNDYHGISKLPFWFQILSHSHLQVASSVEDNSQNIRSSFLMINDDQYDPEATAQSLFYDGVIPEEYKIGKYDVKQ